MSDTQEPNNPSTPVPTPETDTLKGIQEEYNNFCALLGQIEYQHQLKKASIVHDMLTLNQKAAALKLAASTQAPPTAPAEVK